MYDQVQIWSASFDTEPISVLGMQRELSAAIAQQVRLRLSPDRLTALARRHSRDAEAYDLYLRGRFLDNQLTAATTKRALEYYSRATELDPNYALAWSGLADAYSASPINGDAPPLVVGPRARDAAAQAVRAEPDLAETQTALGYVKFFLDWDWPAAEEAFRRATTLDANYSSATRIVGVLLSHMGRHQEARPWLQRARELDPLYPMNHSLSAHVAFQARDYLSAIDFARHTTVVDPEFWIGYFTSRKRTSRPGSRSSR